MKISIFYLLLPLVSVQALQAQDSLRKQNSVVTLSLVSPSASYAPRWNAGYVRKVSPRWWAGIELGYGSDGSTVTHMGDADILADDYRLFEIRPEIYYDLRPGRKLKHLLSLELFYISHKNRFTNGWYEYKSENAYYEYDAADYKRIKTGLTLNLNTVYYLTPKLVLWQQIGGGVRNRNVTYSSKVNNRLSARFNDGEDHFQMFGEENHIKKEGSYFGFEFNLELKLAYLF